MIHKEHNNKKMVNKTKFMQQRFEKMQMSHAKCGLFLGSSLNSSKRKKENKKKLLSAILCVFASCNVTWDEHLGLEQDELDSI